MSKAEHELKPGEHKIPGCGVYIEPFFEEVELQSVEKEIVSFLEIAKPYAKDHELFQEAVDAFFVPSSTLRDAHAMATLAVLYRYVSVLRKLPHTANSSPRNVARDLLYIIRYGTTRPSGSDHYSPEGV